ncbi:MAG: glutathione S-transferase family protein [Pseudomonadota bacterium]
MDILYATFGSGNCFKAHLAFRQLGIPYETRWIDVLKGETRTEAFLKINPAGTVPCLVTSTGQTITESNAMLWHIAHGSELFPAAPMEQTMAIQWMVFEQCKLEPFISPARFFTTIVPEKYDEMREQIALWQEKGHDGLLRLDAHLADHPFMLGARYTLADIALYGYVHVAEEGGFDMSRYPNVARWMDRVATTDDYAPILSFKAAA